MDFDFSLYLLIAVMITGAVWVFDAFMLSPGRRKSFASFLDKSGINKNEYEAYDPEAKNKQGNDDLYHQANALEREPIVVEYAKSFFPVLLAVLVIRSFLFEPFQIPTGSMIPTLKVGDYILVNKYSFGLRLPVIGTKIMNVDEPERGDVMVFIPPHDPTYYIKRVIGLPGDHIRYEGKVLYINGEEMQQEFVAFLQDGSTSVVYQNEQLGEVSHDIYTAVADVRYQREDDWLPPEGRVVPDGHYFMMGDNRDNSYDSRAWGPVSEEKIVGKAVAVWMHKEPGSYVPSFSDNRLINPDQ